MTYATVQDLILRYPETESVEASKLEVLLEDAFALIRFEGGKAEDLTDDEKSVYKGVCCDMVNAFVTQESIGDVSQQSITAGPFTQSTSFRTPPGALRVTMLQRKLLGLSAMVIGSIPANYGEQA